MPVAKKKSPKKKTSWDQLEKLADLKAQEFAEESEHRFHRAMDVYEAQDEDTQEAIDRMADVMKTIGRTQMWVSTSRTGPRKIVYFSPDTIRHNALYLAVEAVKDLALMDVRVANFKFIDRCVTCGKKVKRKGKR